MLSRPSGLVGAAACAVLLLAPAVASAKPGEDKVIAGPVDYNATDHTFRTLTIKSGGTLRILPMNAGKPLMISANTIVIEQGGMITVDQAGYAGMGNAAGAAPPSTTGGGGYGLNVGMPGGGGAMFGAGANGALSSACTDNASSPGGAAFFDAVNNTPESGAAGGAAHTPTGVATQGASGGGVIVLRAGKITIDGALSARGGSANPAIGGVGPGGGAGGTIKLVAGLVDGSGSISVRGGDGAHGNGQPPTYQSNDGGGGSGGVIVLELGVTLPATVTTDLAGGKTGSCSTSGAAGGIVQLSLAGGCLDLDSDGQNAASCGGPDCDDTRDDVNTTAKETCDGEDNDCKGGVDDGDLCAGEQICSDGKCIDNPDAGTDAGGASDGGLPDHVEFGGGCAVPARGGLAEGAIGAGLLALGTLFLGARRRRRR